MGNPTGFPLFLCASFNFIIILSHPMVLGIFFSSVFDMYIFASIWRNYLLCAYVRGPVRCQYQRIHSVDIFADFLAIIAQVVGLRASSSANIFNPGQLAGWGNVFNSCRHNFHIGMMGDGPL